MKPIAVLQFTSPVLHPAPASAGEFLVIYPDRCEIVRSTPNNQGAWLDQWMQGNLIPASAEDAERLAQLLAPEPPPPPASRPRLMLWKQAG